MAIYEIRKYTVKPGTINKQLNIYYQLGYEVQVEHLGMPIIYAKTEVGDVNAYVHLWRYESFNDRLIRRSNLESDPKWKKYKEEVLKYSYQVSQENSILSEAFPSIN
ncbi:MAG: NIPSNAP family protein [Pseudomonadales bacterium]